MAKLDAILKVRKRLEEEAAARLKTHHDELARSEAQEVALRELAADYSGQHINEPPQSADSIKHFRLFYAQLHDAIHSQRSAVEHLRRSLAEHEARFHEARKDRRALQNLIRERDANRKYAEKRTARKVIDALYPRKGLS